MVASTSKYKYIVCDLNYVLAVSCVNTSVHILKTVNSILIAAESEQSGLMRF